LSTKSLRMPRAGTNATSRPWARPGHSGWSSAIPSPRGVGASSVEQGWVLQAWRILAEQGIYYRIVNLSISGATTTDVIEREIPAMNSLAAAPALVTVFIGSNDILHHDLRMNLAAHYQALIDAPPAGSLIAVTSKARGALAEINRTVAAAAATGAIQAVPVRIAQGKRAEDHFHPSDEGYSLIAADFAAAIAARERRTPASGGDETSGRQRPGETTPPRRLCGFDPGVLASQVAHAIVWKIRGSPVAVIDAKYKADGCERTDGISLICSPTALRMSRTANTCASLRSHITCISKPGRHDQSRIDRPPRMYQKDGGCLLPDRGSATTRVPLPLTVSEVIREDTWTRQAGQRAQRLPGRSSSQATCTCSASRPSRSSPMC
jgi:lysophospholipase L1-like esterase